MKTAFSSFKNHAACNKVSLNKKVMYPFTFSLFSSPVFRESEKYIRTAFSGILRKLHRQPPPTHPKKACEWNGKRGAGT